MLFVGWSANTIPKDGTNIFLAPQTALFSIKRIKIVPKPTLLQKQVKVPVLVTGISECKVSTLEAVHSDVETREKVSELQ